MTVEPLRNKEQIDRMYQTLCKTDPKYGMLFKFGLNTGLRIGDILPLKVGDIFLENGEYREHLIIAEQKTGKEKKIKLNGMLRKVMQAYIEGQESNKRSYLFASKKGGHIGRVQAYRVLKKAAEQCGIENFGTHSLRKTWGYWTYRISEHDIGLVMDTFNHSSQSITLRYIGIDQDQKDELYSKVQL